MPCEPRLPPNQRPTYHLNLNCRHTWNDGLSRLMNTCVMMKNTSVLWRRTNLFGIPLDGEDMSTRRQFPCGMSTAFTGMKIPNVRGDIVLDYIPNPKQYVMHNCCADEIFLGGSAQPLTCQVYTPFGPKPMGEVQVNDQVSNPDGGVSRIVGVYPQGVKPTYGLTFSDGSYTRCTDDHLWLVQKTRRAYDRQYVWPLSMIRDHMAFQKTFAQPHSVLIPLTQPVTYTVASPHAEVRWPLSGYTLGALLGDGCLREPGVSLYSEDQNICDRVVLESGLSDMERKPGAPLRLPSTLRRAVEQLGLWGCLANTKFIPDAYKITPIFVRRGLMQGLMDTDGTVSKTGAVTYCTVSERLANDVQRLAWSLGYRASITTKVPHYTYKDEYLAGQLAYIVHMNGPHRAELFNLPRKRERCRETDRIKGRRIVSIERLVDQECQCIQVDNPNGLYITDDFIVTHNTFCGKTLGEQMHNALHCLQYGPAANTITLRRTYDQVRQSIVEPIIKRFFAGVFGIWGETDYVFRWHTGATSWYRHMENPEDIEKRQGSGYTLAIYDELTHFKQEMYTMLFAWLRASGDDVHCQMLSASNPGNIGHQWVKKRFITGYEPGTMYWHEMPPMEVNGVLVPGTTLSRIFIPAFATDNKIGLERNPLYLPKLAEGLSPQRFDALVHGNWDLFEGMAFPEFDMKRHVIKPFDIPESWKVIRCLDWGYWTPFHHGWLAQDPETKDIKLIDEIYGHRKGTGSKILGAEKPPQQARSEVVSHEDVAYETGAYPTPRYGVADPQTWSSRGEDACIGDLLNQDGTLWMKAKRGGKDPGVVRAQLFHALLKDNPKTGKPRFQVFDTCAHFIRTFLALQLDDKNTEIVDTDGEDHPYDSVGYGLLDLQSAPASKPVDKAQRKWLEQKYAPRVLV